MHKVLCFFFPSFSASESALKWMSPHNCQGLSQRYKLQPRVIRVTAYTNGSGTAFANITAPTIALVTNSPTFSVLYLLFPLQYKQIRKIIIVLKCCVNLNLYIAYLVVGILLLSYVKVNRILG